MTWWQRLTGKPAGVDYTGLVGAVLVVDAETSGLRPSQGDRVTWWGAATVLDGEIALAASLAVRGTDGLAVFGDAPATVPRYTRQDVVGWLDAAASAAVAVVAHNAAFDARFAHAEFASVGRHLPHTPWMCTMLLARYLFPQWPNHKLVTCLQQAHIPLPTEHDAADESLATARLWEFLVGQARQAGEGDWSQLIEIAGVDPDEAAREDATRPAGASSTGISMTIEITDSMVEELLRPRPVCGDLMIEDIAEPEHRAAHERVEALPYEGRTEYIEAYQALTDAGCPNAAAAWRDLPYVWGKGDRGEFDGSIYVLQKYREMGVTDRERIRSVCITATSAVFDMKKGPMMLLAAQSDLGDWLAGFAPCEMCASRGRQCDCFDLAVTAANHVRLRISDDFAPDLAATVWSISPIDTCDGLEAHVLEPLVVIRDQYPAAQAVLLSWAGRIIERTNDVNTARRLYETAIATGLAPHNAYDRLSLIAERAKEYAFAADLAEEGIRRTDSTTVTKTLTKRVARCRAKP